MRNGFYAPICGLARAVIMWGKNFSNCTYASHPPNEWAVVVDVSHEGGGA